MNTQAEPVMDAIRNIEAAMVCLSTQPWSASKNHVQVPETEDWASCRIECQANKDVARKVAQYIKAVQPSAIREVLQTLASKEAELVRMREWRNLALQFDRQRMDALGHLRELTMNPQHATKAMAFLSLPPLSGEKLFAELCAAIKQPTE